MEPARDAVAVALDPARRVRWALLALLVARILAPALAAAQDPPSDLVLEITFFDVGQADAAMIRSPEGQVALIDAGRAAPLSELVARGVHQIDLLVATHPHADHIGGMVDVLRALPVRYFMDNGQPHTTATYRELLRVLDRRSDITYLEATPRIIELGSVQLEVLPLPGVREVEHNDRSVALVVRFGAFEALLSGDSEVYQLTYLMQRGAVPDLEVLKAPHHGSDNGFTHEFLDAARPELVVISVGANGYGHPGFIALAAYTATAAQVFRTDRDGSVTILAQHDGRFTVRGASTTAPSSAARPPARLWDPEAPSARLPTRNAISLWVHADAAGNDHQNRNAEYAVLTNNADRGVALEGWTLCDAARHCFRFPAGAMLPGHGQVVVHTGSGRSDGTRFFMNSARAIWNNDGDTATLTDASGQVIAQHVYE